MLQNEISKYTRPEEDIFYLNNSMVLETYRESRTLEKPLIGDPALCTRLRQIISGTCSQIHEEHLIKGRWSHNKEIQCSEPEPITPVISAVATEKSSCVVRDA